MLEMGIEKSVLADIIRGTKTIEGRLRTGKFLTMRKGDCISLREDVWQNDKLRQSTPNKATVLVKESLFFDDFATMLKALDYTKIFPTASSPEEALMTYRQFYTSAQEHENGVIAIRFSLVKP